MANIILLAHAVIPHHYHESSVCIEKIICPNCDAHQHEISQKDCNHHDENSSKSCALKQVVFLPVNQEKQDFKWVTFSNKSYQPNGFHSILFSCEFIQFVPGIISDAQIASKTTSYSNFISASKGLRAPPVV